MPLVKAQRQDSSLINQKLPFEILTMIFLLLGPSSFQNPYIYLPLSWVCRRWRSIVLNTSVFWTVIIHQCKKSKLHDLARDVIFRSKPHEIDVASYAVCRGIVSSSCNKCSSKSCFDYFNNFQIKTLYLHGHSEFNFSGGKNLAQVENLILSQVSVQPLRRQQESFHEFLSVVNPRFLELSDTVLCELMPVTQSLDRVEWLKIDVTCLGATIPCVLEALPRLRILNLIGRSHFSEALVINLPNLRVLSMDLDGFNEPYSIRTSALSYLGVSADCSEEYGWDNLNSIDLPMMKSFRIALCTDQFMYPQPFQFACISTGHSGEDCDFFNDFHVPFSCSKKSMDRYWSLPPPNSFHISFPWDMKYEALFSQLKRRATNLVEFIVDYRSIQQLGDRNYEMSQEGYHTFLGSTLDTFDTVTHLTVLRSFDFVSVCDLLMDGRRLPRLERFTYHSLEKPTGGTKVVLKQMEMVQSARVKAGSEPLKTLELQNFLTIPRAQISKLEKLGIHLEQ